MQGRLSVERMCSLSTVSGAGFYRSLQGRAPNLEEMERPGNVVADVALDWLSKNHGGKFFLWMHLYDPHYPYRPPAPYGEEYKDRPYDGEIAFADANNGLAVGGRSS